MLYGNGLESTFFTSGYLYSNGNSTYNSLILPLIAKKNDAGTNYVIKYPNFCDEDSKDYPLLITRAAVIYDNGDRMGTGAIAGFPVQTSTGGGNGGAISRTTYNPDGNKYGYVYDTRIAQMSHVFTNWIDFAKYPKDLSRNFYNIGETSDGSIDFGYTGYYLNTANKDVFHRDDVLIQDVTKTTQYSGATCWYLNASISANFENVHSCPGYAGGIILCSADDAEFEQNKYIAVGFKGLYSDSTVVGSDYYDGVNYNYATLPNDNGMGIFKNTSMYNYSFKLYKFDSTHFTKLSSNTYLFKDKEILPLGYRTYRVYAYMGPFFGEVTANMKNGNNESTLSITNSDYIKTPKIYTSYSYFTEEPIENCISAKAIRTNIDVGENVLSVIGQEGSAPPIYRNFYYSQNTTPTGAYLAAHPFYDCSFGAIYSPSSDNSCGLKISTPLTDIHFGKCLSAFSTINVGWMNFSALTGIDDNWDNWYNINDCGSTDYWVFYNAFKLTRIPSSWNGLTNLYKANCMFKGCSALESLPNSWAGMPRLNTTTSMFKGCSKLTTLPASWAGLDTIVDGSNMFSGCTGLKTIPMDAESWSHLKNCGLTKMFVDCTNLEFDGFAFIDNVVKNSQCSNCLFVTDYSAHGGMFYNCTKITHYAELTAGTNPAYSAYKSFFC